MRLINAGAEGTQHFSIDEHNLTIVTNDYVPVTPYDTNAVTLGVAQRTDVLVRANGSPDRSYYMRSNISTVCDPARNPNAVAAIYYQQADTSKLPNSTPQKYDVDQCANDPLAKTVPAESLTPPPSPALTETIEIGLGFNKSGNQLFFMNNSSFCGDYNSPILLLANAGNNTAYPAHPEWNSYNVGTNSSVRIVLYNTTPLWHPMHLHGHNFWVLAEGNGIWNGTVTNALNPQRRDVQIIRSGSTDDPGYLVLEFATDNPGIWPLHCHISWWVVPTPLFLSSPLENILPTIHVCVTNANYLSFRHISVGLLVTIIEQPAQIQQLDVPDSVAQVCRDWWIFTSHDVIDQIDSGL